MVVWLVAMSVMEDAVDWLAMGDTVAAVMVAIAVRGRGRN